MLEINIGLERGNKKRYYLEWLHCGYVAGEN
jgi:hypothetical protein